jgi:hypothetical protein
MVTSIQCIFSNEAVVGGHQRAAGLRHKDIAMRLPREVELRELWTTMCAYETTVSEATPVPDLGSNPVVHCLKAFQNTGPAMGNYEQYL